MMSRRCARSGRGRLSSRASSSGGREDRYRSRRRWLIVSNHGGRQLDGAPATLDALPGVVEAVGGRIPVLLDGGVRRGVDVVKALALGADACLIGRPQLWGLAVAGEAGVAHVLDIFRREIDRVMGLCGVARIADIGQRIIISSHAKRKIHMIKDPPLLTVRQIFARPNAEEVAAFANVQTGHAVDAMNGRGALDYRIKPLAPPATPMVGVAITCHCGPADNLALFAALAAAKPGDILVAATDEFTTTSVTGDLLMGMARNRGILGLVTDGLARDLAGIVGVGLPVYCAGLTPNSPVRNGPGTVGLPVVLGGVAIDPATSPRR